MSILIYAILGIIKFLLTLQLGLTICIFQLASLLLVRPLSDDLNRKINGILMDIMLSFGMHSGFSGIKIKVQTDAETYRLLGKEPAIMLANHRHTLDHAIMMMVTQFFSSFGNTLSPSKSSVKFYPIYGWLSWLSGGIVFLERNWVKDESKLKASLEPVKKFCRPWWFIIYPEGTRLTSEKLLAAREYASSQGLPIPNNVLVPRTKGFVCIVKHSRPYFRAVYDLTIVVPHGLPPLTLVNVVIGQKTTVKIHIKRFLMNDLPESEKDVALWCRERFLAKDTFLDKFMIEDATHDQITCLIRAKNHIYVTVAWASLVLESCMLVYHLFIYQNISTNNG